MPITTPTYYGAAPAYAPPVQPQYPQQMAPPTKPVERQVFFMEVENQGVGDAYPLAPMCTAYLITKDKTLLIEKSSDEYGRIQYVNKYNLVKEEDSVLPPQPAQFDETKFATKDQLDDFVKRKDYDELLEMIGNLQDEISNITNPNEDSTTSSRGRKAGKQ